MNEGSWVGATEGLLIELRPLKTGSRYSSNKARIGQPLSLQLEKLKKKKQLNFNLRKKIESPARDRIIRLISLRASTRGKREILEEKSH